MNAAAAQFRGRWVIAGICGVAVVASFLFLVRFPPPPTPIRIDRPGVSASRDASVKIVDRSDVLMKEEMELRDLRPLFLPTIRNAALPDPHIEPAQTFLDSENLSLPFSAAELQISQSFPQVVQLRGKALVDVTVTDVLDAGATDVGLLGFGRSETTLRPLPARGGFVEVTNTRDGRRVLAEELPVAARPISDKVWAPVEFLAVVDAAGLASPLVVTEGSRVDEVDAHFKNFLAGKFRIGDRLEPGLYRVTVAP